MIKQIDNIPNLIKPVSQSELIRADIKEAVDKGIKCFEFEGYTLKSVSTVVRQESDRLIGRIARARMYEILTEEYPENKERVYSPRYDFTRKFYSVRTVKTDGITHTYEMIDLSTLDVELRKHIESEIRRSNEYEERRKERRESRLLKLEPSNVEDNV